MSCTGDESWGHLADTEHFGRHRSQSAFSVVNIEDTSLLQYEEFTHAAHCMIYSKQSEKVFGIYNPRAAVLMQMRFDGYLGFPGGLIDPGENVLCGLNRELEEEVNFNTHEYPVKENNHVVTHSNAESKLLLHFYALEVPMKDFQLTEKNALSARDYGSEVLGLIRVPLYVMGDGYRGFPAFLNNAFIGNSKEQLLHTLQYLQIMSKTDVDKALNSKQK